MDSDGGLNLFLTIGVDPGLSGAAAVIGPQGDLLSVKMLPTHRIAGNERTFVESFSEMFFLEFHTALWGGHMFIEMVQNYGPSSSKKSILSSGIGWGMLAHAALVDPFLGSVTAVKPQDWQKTMLLGVKGGDTKAKARAKCIELWPSFGRWPTVSKGEHAGEIRDGAADAALIGLWGHRKLMAKGAQNGK